jgi:hypothetical protein
MPSVDENLAMAQWPNTPSANASLQSLYLRSSHYQIETAMLELFRLDRRGSLL